MGNLLLQSWMDSINYNDTIVTRLYSSIYSGNPNKHAIIMMDEMSLGGFSKKIDESTSTVELDFSHLEVNDRVKFVIILSPVIKPRYSGVLSLLPVSFKSKITNSSQKQSYHHLR